LKHSIIAISLIGVALSACATAPVAPVSFKTSKLVNSVSKMTQAEQLELAKDANADPADHRVLAYSRYPDVRIAVASTSCQKDVLNWLSTDQEEAVREAVGGNKCTAPVTLSAMIVAKNVTIRTLVAIGGNTSTLTVDLDKLSTANKPEVRASTAPNPNLSEAARLQLEKDTDLQVRGKLAPGLKTTPSVLDDLGHYGTEPVQVDVAGNPNTPAGTMIFLAQNESVKVRLAVVANKNIPIQGLLILANDVDDAVRTQALQRLQAIQ